ncbi:hypothetical protein LCGC14_1924070, partial [marine sediment metagenome]
LFDSVYLERWNEVGIASEGLLAVAAGRDEQHVSHCLVH